MERFAVIGLGRFGFELASLLADAGEDVIAVDRNRRIVEEITTKVPRAVVLDATDEAALTAQGIDEVDCAIVGIGGDFESAVLTTLLLSHLSVKKIISRATSFMRANILSRCGAHETVNPEQESAYHWHTMLVSRHVFDQIKLAEDHVMARMVAPASFVDKSLVELQIRQKFDVQIIAIHRQSEDTNKDGTKRKREHLINVPAGETKIRKDDILVVVGKTDRVRELDNL